ncbi:hypothetical protein Pcinc_004765 [Petrolisthes cinctipes]|uniref:Uncharacterized protein n=1 Tax=Petrolisthes cinctipes TaxID=88211 RepID=A0AAE1KZS2_PETCI|nr:hypothetical protein Pcinc_004765 [Petrolisthes cinctipes]
MISLRSFVLNPVCLDWISSHVTSHSLWREAGEVAVGQDTKQYFDQFGFDFRKSVMVASGIHSVYHSSNTMKVSVTENKNWGRTHCFDETYEFEKQPTECSTNMKVYPAVVMYISCSSRTSACRLRFIDVHTGTTTSGSKDKKKRKKRKVDIDKEKKEVREKEKEWEKEVVKDKKKRKVGKN